MHHLRAKYKVPEQHILQKHSKCNSFRVIYTKKPTDQHTLKSIFNFEVTNRQTDKQTNRQTDKRALRPRLSGNFKILLQSTDNLLHYKIPATHLLHWVQIWPPQSSYCSAME